MIRIVMRKVNESAPYTYSGLIENILYLIPNELCNRFYWCSFSILYEGTVGVNWIVMNKSGLRNDATVIRLLLQSIIRNISKILFYSKNICEHET